MTSPLMSPPHNGTPFIYFTERTSSVISTALKSYYLYANDEWIECSCQEQYLFISCGQFFFPNSISSSPLNVMDKWWGLTSLSRVEISKSKDVGGLQIRRQSRGDDLALTWPSQQRHLDLVLILMSYLWERGAEWQPRRTSERYASDQW